MSKRKRESKITQYRKRIQEGSATRIHGWKTQRLHHLLSDLERSYYYILEWSDTVIDIREHSHLLPIEETLEIAE